MKEKKSLLLLFEELLHASRYFVNIFKIRTLVKWEKVLIIKCAINKNTKRRFTYMATAINEPELD